MINELLRVYGILEKIDPFGWVGLSEQGCAAWYFWNEISSHFDNMKLDAFVVMPNHVHGIIKILPDNNGNHSVGPLHATALQKTNLGNKMSEISPKPKSLSVAVRSYKSAVTRWCNSKNYEMAWQSRFYDHIIRNQKSLDNIRQYIEMNPVNWETDQEYSLNSRS